MKPSASIKKYLSGIGTKGGKSTSDAKRAASKLNGKLGGFPRKSVSIDNASVIRKSENQPVFTAKEI